jgi:hypothetical protein
MEASMKTNRIEVLAPAKPRHQGNQPRVLKLRKVSVEVELPSAPDFELANLLLFDSRAIDAETKKELLRLFPALVQNSRAWTARFAEHGCVACHRRKVPYGAGGFCNRCQVRELRRMQKWYRNNVDRDTTEEMWSIVRKLNAAQALLNGDEEDEKDLSAAMQKRLARIAQQVGCANKNASHGPRLIENRVTRKAG